MKKLLSLLFITVAAMLPKSVWAEVINDSNPRITIDGTTLTINSTSASSLKSFMDGASSDTKTSMKACTKIELDGKFNESDLSAISNAQGFTAVTEVDMAKAKFVTTTGGSAAPEQGTYYLYHSNEARNAATHYNGDRAIVSGTLYESAQNVSWVELDESEGKSKPDEGTNVMVLPNATNTVGFSVSVYGKVAKSGDIYLKMHVTPGSMSGPFAQGENQPYDTSSDSNDLDKIHVTGHTDEPWVLNLISADSKRPVNYKFGVYRYYYCNGTVWKRSTKNVYDNATHKVTDQTGVDLDALESESGDATEASPERAGWAMRVVVYYIKTAQEVREWQTGTPTSEEIEGATTATFDYYYRENHMSDFSDGTWVKMTDYDYYQLRTSSGWYWKQTTYADGESHWIIKKYDNGTNPNSVTDGLPNQANQYAVVMGTEKLYNGSEWTDPGVASEISNYSDMKFSYWSSTLVRAITSKYADENINSDIFANCTALTYVDFKAGVVKGFGDHKTEAGYTANSLEVNIGQNVTKIGSDAFLRCDALKKVTFDAGNGSADAITGRSYPLDLVIDDGAFQDCVNLDSITIPNRVSEIGNNTFKSAGNSTDEFVVNFQRRYEGSTSSTAIEGYNGTLLTIGADAFGYCSKLKHISLPIRMTSMGNSIFENSGLESFEIREDIEDAKVKTIPSNAFLSCHLTEINIPRSVTLIEGGAFSNTPTMKTIRFQKQNSSPQEPLIIKELAFAGGNEQDEVLADVYVDFTPKERLTICEYNAFSFTSLVGQTNEGSRQMAKLHFPEEAWDFYQGDWKRGLAFRQSNQSILNAFKDGYTSYYGGVEGQESCVGMGTTIDETPTATGKYTKEGYTGDAKYIAPANGWQQFAMSSTDIDIVIPTGSFMRSYSTNKSYVIPKFAEDRSGNGFTVKKGHPMFDTYRIISFSDGFNPETNDPKSKEQAQAASRVAIAKQVTDEDDSNSIYVPKNTGLIMVGKADDSYLVYFADAKFTTATERTYPFNICTYDATSATDSLTNLLYPTCIKNQKYDGTFDGQGKPNETASEYLTGAPVATINASGDSIVTLNSTIPYPYYHAEDVQFRLFGYSPSSNKFIRTKGAWSTRDKAYLKLPASLFHWTCEYDGDANSGSSSGVQDPTAAAAASREVMLNFIDEEEESGTTGIKQVDTTMQRMDSNVFYTLEGVKLTSRPTQRGIYIHNGRKVVIK